MAIRQVKIVVEAIIMATTKIAIVVVLKFVEIGLAIVIVAIVD